MLQDAVNGFGFRGVYETAGVNDSKVRAVRLREHSISGFLQEV